MNHEMQTLSYQFAFVNQLYIAFFTILFSNFSNKISKLCITTLREEPSWRLRNITV